MLAAVPDISGWFLKKRQALRGLRSKIEGLPALNYYLRRRLIIFLIRGGCYDRVAQYGFL